MRAQITPEQSRRAASLATQRATESLAPEVRRGDVIDLRSVDWAATAADARALLRRERFWIVD